MDSRPNRVDIKVRFRISSAYCGRGLSCLYSVMVWVRVCLKGTIVGD